MTSLAATTLVATLLTAGEPTQVPAPSLVPPPAAASVAVLPLRHDEGLAAVAGTLDGLFAASLRQAAPELRLTTQDELARRLAGLRDPQGTRCSDGACAAKLAQVLGVDGVISGSVEQAAPALQLSLAWIDAKRGVLARHRQALGQDPNNFDTDIDVAARVLLRRAAEGPPVATTLSSSFEALDPPTPPSGKRRLSQADIFAVIKQSLAQGTACLGQIARPPDAPLILSWTIRRDGSVANAAASQTDRVDPKCVAALMQGWHFPPADEETNVQHLALAPEAW